MDASPLSGAGVQVPVKSRCSGSAGRGGVWFRALLEVKVLSSAHASPAWRVVLVLCLCKAAQYDLRTRTGLFGLVLHVGPRGGEGGLLQGNAKGLSVTRPGGLASPLPALGSSPLDPGGRSVPRPWGSAVPACKRGIVMLALLRTTGEDAAAQVGPCDHDWLPPLTLLPGSLITPWFTFSRTVSTFLLIKGTH